MKVTLAVAALALLGACSHVLPQSTSSPLLDSGIQGNGAFGGGGESVVGRGLDSGVFNRVTVPGRTY